MARGNARRLPAHDSANSGVQRQTRAELARQMLSQLEGLNQANPQVDRPTVSGSARPFLSDIRVVSRQLVDLRDCIERGHGHGAIASVIVLKEWVHRLEERAYKFWYERDQLSKAGRQAMIERKSKGLR